MATVTWLIKKNAEAPVTLAAAGIVDMALSYRANGVDTATFTSVDDYTADPAWPFGSVIAVIRRVTDGGLDTDTCVFVGTVETVPPGAQDAHEDITYTACGPSFGLQLCDYLQQWAYTDESGALQTLHEPSVVLGENNAGTRLRNGEVVSDVIAWAASQGVNIAAGAIAPGVWIPYDERDNVKCWDAIVSVLRHTPDYVLWWDYDHQVAGSYVPAANLTAPSAMSAVSKALHAADVETARFTPRHDLRVPGIVIVYRWTGEYDGRAIKRRFTDTAGDVNSPRRATLVYDLEGSRSVFVSQDVEVEDYPADWTASAGRAFLKARLPQLSDLADANWTVASVTRSGSQALPARLVSGSLAGWMDKDSETETFTASIDYTIKSSDTGNILESGTRKLTFTCVSTDATTKTYRKQTEWIAPEPVPPDMAAALYASWNRLHYDGSVMLRESECSMDVLPGRLLSLTGGRPEWASMAAVVQDVTCNIAEGTTAVRTGTCGRLEADNLMALYRAARGRRFSVLRLGRDSGDATDGNAVDAGGLTPNDSADGGTPPVLRERFAVEAYDASSRLHRVDINPSAIAFQVSGSAAPLNIAVKEVLLPVESDGKVTGAKRAQVLVCTPYGDELPLDAPEPEDPTPGEGGTLPSLPAPPDAPPNFESITWVGGEPIIDLNSGDQQDAPVRLRAVLPLDDLTFYPCKFIAARFPDKGDEADSLGIVRGLDTDASNKLMARLAGVDAKPAASTAQRVYGHSSTGAWGLFELESLFKFDAANKRFYIDLAGYTNFKSLSDDATAFDFNSDANIAGKNGATFDVVTDVAWDSTNNELVVKKRTVTLFKFGLKSISAASPTATEIETGGQFDVRYDASSAQLQKSTDGGTTWTMISGGQAVAETV
ncbi:MAG TPA: hypothetical protein P5026_05465 [Kiritimatiellia bacterium]|nr:hypothetical protein [Kiritimatiellia bacterium]